MKAARPILVTGFEPFAEEASNPSAAIAARLDGTTLAGRAVVRATLPVVFGESRRILARLLRRHDPSLVVCLGVAAGRRAISLERVAINLDDARLPDNAGAQPVDVPVVRGGPAAYWSTLPLRRMAAAIAGAGLPVELSNSAGTYVCNHLFYGLMHLLRKRTGTCGGFIHVPRLRRGLSVARMARALERAIAEAARSI